MARKKKEPWYDLPSRLVMFASMLGGAIYIGYAVDPFVGFISALPLGIIGHIILNAAGVHTDAAKFGKAIVGR